MVGSLLLLHHQHCCFLQVLTDLVKGGVLFWAKHREEDLQVCGPSLEVSGHDGGCVHQQVSFVSLTFWRMLHLSSYDALTSKSLLQASLQSLHHSFQLPSSVLNNNNALPSS